MATNTTINTRILLRNDTLASWTSSSLVLGKGEVAIALGANGQLAEVRVGNNTTWANSQKLAVDAAQISGLNEQISGIALEYRLTAGTGDDTNKWFLESKELSADTWTTVSTLDLTQLTGYALSTDVDALVSATKDEISGTVAATYLSASTFTEISNEIGLSAASSSNKVATANDLTAATADISATVANTYLSTAAFDDYKNEVGLSAASASNPVVTKDDIADLAGAMHFRGAVTPNEGETDAEAIAREITDPASGDVVIVTTTSKEYVYNGTTWIELGDEVLYATKAEVNAISTELTSDIAGLTADVDYLSGQIDATNSTLNTVSSDYLKAADKTELETLIGTVSAATLDDAKDYTDEVSAALSGDYVSKIDAAKTEAYNEALSDANAYTDEVSAALSGDYVQKIADAIDSLSIGDYALSADVDALVADVSAATYTSAYNDAKGYVDDILSGYLILDCGQSTLRTDEPAYTAGA